jgi:hypothetical protein
VQMCLSHLSNWEFWKQESCWPKGTVLSLLYIHRKLYRDEKLTWLMVLILLVIHPLFSDNFMLFCISDAGLSLAISVFWLTGV